ncbi:DUF362 domain-containing protein [Bengtsoniella intestinalis]|uniref:DUF362 domain-containing protein n=1 Tax=Bengtsoniella intestinalis TaxID=3073143 RepID=UPI00391F35A9
MSKTVFVQTVTHYNAQLVEQAVETLFSQLEAPQMISSQTRILLKPNILAKHPPEHAVTTHPIVVQAVIHACVRRGAKPANILLADSSGGVYHPSQIKSFYKTCGFASLETSEGISLYTDCQSTVIQTINGRVAKEFDIINPALEADFIINLPKYKTHVMTGMTAACKNMFGLVPGLKKSQWHMRFPDKERFGHMLMDLLEVCPPQMAILDGIIGMEGDGPAGGTPRCAGVLMASEDMVNLDLAIAHMMGLAPMRVPYLQAAYQRGLGDSAIDLSTVVGDLPVMVDWQLPRSYQGNSESCMDFADHIPKVFTPLIRKIESAIAPQPLVIPSLCIGCGKCKEICPQDTISIVKGKANVHHKQCIRCFCCHEVCPVKAIDIKSFSLFKL